LEEGRLLILANTRGNALLETEFVSQFNKDQPFPWTNVPSAFTQGKEEAVMPDQISIGLEKLLLAALPPGRDSVQRMEYSFLHGKCATNEIYFDEIIPAQGYRLITSFIDRKTNERYSELSEVQVYPGTTTIMVITFYVPSERERIRNKQIPRIDVFKLFGKGTEVLPN